MRFTGEQENKKLHDSGLSVFASFYNFRYALSSMHNISL